MIHTISTMHGLLTVQPDPATRMARLTFKHPIWPAQTIELKPEETGLLAQAFDLVTEELDQLQAVR